MSIESDFSLPEWINKFAQSSPAETDARGAMYEALEAELTEEFAELTMRVVDRILTRLFLLGYMIAPVEDEEA